ncbi:ribonuclease E/G [Sulfitobacter sp. LCG007]
MAKKMLIDATHAEETRVVVVDGNKVEEFDFESENKRQLAGNIYLAKVTRVEPSLQAAFVEYGGNRHGFLAFSEIHPDYYQIPIADRQALMEEERAYAEAQKESEDDDEKPKKRGRSRSRSRSKAAESTNGDATATREISGMETVDLDDEDEGLSPMERVGETPVEESLDDAGEGGSEAADTSAGDGDSGADDAHEDAHDDGGDHDEGSDAASRDDTIESVAEEDDSEDLRPARKPRPRRYKIQEVIKVRQILLVQVVKEERGNKGAALTTYLSLAGRYCVLMPNTARGGGISRKITNAADRKKLKEIAAEIDVPTGAGLIVRTAGSRRTKAEIKRDYEYLQRLWEQIRELTLKSIAPAKIYEEGDLIKRSIRDLYNRDIDEVMVEGERGYRNAKDFMKMIMPSHSKNVKLYSESLPLFARYQVESYLAAMFNPTVQLPSGGYIVIGVTEALVAIDVNSGRATKEGSIEQTALKTNLEAADEVARQLRLRDLAGLIVIDFIDMDERKNNAAVEKRIKDKLKTDRARIQIGRISGFGLMEMSRQRLRPGMIEATTQPCRACHGTGLIRSDDNLALSILRQIEEEGTRKRSREVLVRAPVGIANFLMNQKREHIAHIEGRYGMAIRIEGDPSLISPDFALEKFKTATRAVPVATAVVSVDMSLEDLDEDIDVDETPEAEEDEAQSTQPEPNEGDNGDDKPKRRRRRRRRGRGKSSGGEGQNGHENSSDADAGNDDTRDEARQTGENAADTAEPASGEPATGESSAEVTADAEEAPEAEAAKKTRSRSRSRSRKKTDPEADASPETPSDTTAAAESAGDQGETAEAPTEAEAEAPPPKPKATRSRSRKKAPEQTAEPTTEESAAPEAAAPEAAAQTETAEQPAEPTAAQPEPEPETVAAAPEEPAKQKPKRRGWWSLGG